MEGPTGLVGEPTSRAPRLYRALLGLVGAIGRWIFGFRIEVIGSANLPRDPDGRPAGGWIAAGLPHRTWVDPFVVALSLPVEPRLVFFGDGRAIFRSRWRRWAFRRIGGVIPIWPGGHRAAIESHLAGASASLDAGAVLCLFPERGSATPPGTARPLGLGLAYFALRTGADIVPIVLGGTHELYRGRQFRLEVLAPISGRALAGLRDGDPDPAPWSREESAAAHRLVDALHALTSRAVAEAHAATEPPPGTRKHWRWLTTRWR